MFSTIQFEPNLILSFTIHTPLIKYTKEIRSKRQMLWLNDNLISSRSQQETYVSQRRVLQGDNNAHEITTVNQCKTMENLE